MMTRRGFLRTVSVSLLAAPLVAEAQQAARTYRIGYLAPGTPSYPATDISRAFRQGLVDAGYIEGRDVIVDRRCFPTEQMAGKVLEDLLKTTPNILVGASNRAAVAIRDAAPAIPVVFVNAADPVGSRMVQSLARPGGNMTGLADLTLDLNAKRVQLLNETLPNVRLVSTLSTPDDPGTERFRAEIDRAAVSLGLQMKHFTVIKAEHLPAAFESIKKDGLGAVIVMQGALFWTERSQIASLAAKHRLPSMYATRALVEGGGLIGYGADQAATRRAAGRAANEVRLGDQPQDRQGARVDDAAVAAALRRPNHRVSPVRSDLDRRRSLLTAALGFALLDTRGQPAPSEGQTVRKWLDNWTGVGHVVTGMQRQDYDLELARYDGRGWCATFFVTGIRARPRSRHPGVRSRWPRGMRWGRRPGRVESRRQRRMSSFLERVALGRGPSIATFLDQR